MVTEHRLSRVKACKLAGVSRAALYRERTDWAKRDTPVVQALNEVVEHHGRWWVWKCFHRLRDQGHVWNHKKVHRVYCSMKLNLPRRAKKRVPVHELNEVVSRATGFELEVEATQMPKYPPKGQPSVSTHSGALREWIIEQFPKPFGKPRGWVLMGSPQWSLPDEIKGSRMPKRKRSTD